MRKRIARGLHAARLATTGRIGRGQSVVEFALVLPVLLLIILVGIDFGRVYLGYINLQQAARIAANFAADHAAGMPGDAEIVARYTQIVRNEVSLSNCNLHEPGGVVPSPMWAVANNPRPTGSGVTVGLECDFSLITPIISGIIGNTITASASATFPVKEGVVVAGDPSGGGTTLPPTADFIGSPQSGYGPLEVTFTDRSLNLPGSWSWSFSSRAEGGSGTGSVAPSSQSGPGPHAVTYGCAGNPGDTCTFSVSLHVSNTAGSDDKEQVDYISVKVPPASGPVADFTANPTTGTEPLQVDFVASDPTATSWSWDFGDGQTATTETPSNTYATYGEYDVTLTVSDGTTTSEPLEKKAFVVVSRRLCTVPDFANVRVNNASALWVAAGFSSANLTALSGPGNYLIKGQSLVGGTIDPQPAGCASSITVGPTP